MSNAEGKPEAGPERHGFPALDQAVGLALGELRRLRERAGEAERKSAELASLLHSFESGEESAVAMKERLVHLEAENADLRSRIERGRDTVERLIARVSFLENQK